MSFSFTINSNTNLYHAFRIITRQVNNPHQMGIPFQPTGAHKAALLVVALGTICTTQKQIYIFSSLRYRWSWIILTILLQKPSISSSLKRLNYWTIQSFDLERTCMMKVFLSRTASCALKIRRFRFYWMSTAWNIFTTCIFCYVFFTRLYLFTSEMWHSVKT